MTSEFGDRSGTTGGRSEGAGPAGGPGWAAEPREAVAWDYPPAGVIEALREALGRGEPVEPSWSNPFLPDGVTEDELFGRPAPDVDDLLAMLTPALARLIGDGSDSAEVAVASGWWPLLAETDRRLAAIDPDYVLLGAGHAADGRLAVDAVLVSDGLPENSSRQDRFRKVLCGAAARSGELCELCGDVATPVETDEGRKVRCSAHAPVTR